MAVINPKKGEWEKVVDNKTVAEFHLSYDAKPTSYKLAKVAAGGDAPEKDTNDFIDAGRVGPVGIKMPIYFLHPDITVTVNNSTALDVYVMPVNANGKVVS